MRASERRHMRIFFFTTFALLAVLFFVVLKPFLVSVIAGLIIAYVFFPLHKHCRKITRSPIISSFLITALLILIIAVPLLLIVNNTAQEAKAIYVQTQELLATGFQECGGGSEIICTITDKISGLLAIPQVRQIVEESITKMTSFIVSEASTLILSVPRMILLLFVTFFTTFYAFNDGQNLVARIKMLLPFKKKIIDSIFRRTSLIIHGVVFGTIAIALIQGTLGGIAFYVAGIGSPLIWGLMMVFLALIPMVGTAFVWVPASIILFLNGYAAGNMAMVYNGAGLFLFGALVISTIDNILKPRLISGKARIHPVMILVGVLGGLAAFGIMGFLLGPIIIALFEAFIEIYELEKKELVG